MMTAMIADRCAGCYFVEACEFSAPCKYYTPLTDGHLAEEEVREYHQEAYEDDYRRYLKQYSNEN